jgi:hypothetical protein
MSVVTTMVAFLLVLSAPALADVTLPFPGMVICRSDFLALDKVKRLITDVPGKPGEKGVLEGEIFDSKGNRIQVWCLLKKIPDHGGPDLAYLFTPNMGKGLWIGACTFDAGQNNFTYSYKMLVRFQIPIKTNVFIIKRPTMDANGKITDVEFLRDEIMVRQGPDMFTGFFWHNYEGLDPKNPQAERNDFEYSYDVAKNQLTISKTTGTFVNGKYMTKTRDTQRPDPPPDNFKDLKFKGVQITLGNGDNSAASPPYRLVLSHAGHGGQFLYSLISHQTTGSGTPADPFTGVEVVIKPGDELTIGAAGIDDASVTGVAAQPMFGGWQVKSFDDSRVTFEATSMVVFEPGTVIDGFGLQSDRPVGMIPWGVVSTDDLSTTAGFAFGPAAGP